MAFEQMQREVEKQDKKKVKEENENDEEAIDRPRLMSETDSNHAQ